jgi:hypothetical protein
VLDYFSDHRKDTARHADLKACQISAQISGELSLTVKDPPVPKLQIFPQSSEKCPSVIGYVSILPSITAISDTSYIRKRQAGASLF